MDKYRVLFHRAGNPFNAYPQVEIRFINCVYSSETNGKLTIEN